MRGLVCTLLRGSPEDRSNWSAFPNVDGEVRDNLSSCEWYEGADDSIEAIHHRLVNRDEEEAWDRGESRAEYFAAELNKYFRRQGYRLAACRR